jgi:hypothetical protein
MIAILRPSTIPFSAGATRKLSEEPRWSEATRAAAQRLPGETKQPEAGGQRNEGKQTASGHRIPASRS